MRHISSSVNTSAASHSISPGTYVIMRELADTADMLVWTSEADGKWTFLSSAIRTLFHGADTVYLEHWLQFVHPEDVESVRQTLAAASASHIDLQCEHRIVRSDGTVRWMLGIAAPRFTEDGNFNGYCGATIDITVQHDAFAKLETSGIGRDVTSERQLQQKLAQLAEANRALIENSPDGLIVFDEADRISRAEGAVKHILGYEPEELIGRYYLDFVVPEMSVETRREVERVRSNPDYLPRRETCWRRKDGGTAVLSWAVRWSKERPSTLFATVRDVTEVHRTRTALHRINERLVATLESIGDAFFSLDSEWRLTYINLKAARFIGRDRDPLLGKLLWEAVPEIVGSSVLSYYQQAMLSRECAFFETYYEPARAWVEVRAYPHEEGMSIYFHDITQRRETERLVRQREQRLHDMIALTPAGYIEMDADGVVLAVNPALCAMTGFSRKEFVGERITTFADEWPLGRALKTRHGLVSAHGEEVVLRHRLGQDLHLLANFTIERDSAGSAISLTGFFTDITERKHTADQLEHLATHDVLTSLPNRLASHRHLRQMLETNPRDESVAVMFLDLDRFKRINDSMGHVVGDRLLQQVAHRLGQVIRPADMIARFGGDEFIVTAHCPDGRSGAAELAASLQAALSEPFEIDGNEVFVGASIGVSMLNAAARSKGALYQNANTALFRAKAAGRNDYRFFEAEMAVEAKERMALEGALRHALERGELDVHYQPQLDLCSGRIVGVEALLRWQHPEWGKVSPARFIPVAEETGLIVPIGAWVLLTACKQATKWRSAGFGDLRMAVNLSARQFSQTDLVHVVAGALKESGLPAGRLDLELTESMVMSDFDRTVEVLTKLKNLGVKLSVDDFGTGYSGLAYLKRFPVDVLKIDRSFVQEISHSSSDAAIPDAIIAMAHTLGIRVVAEGVETEVQCEVLSRMMCDEMQGYLFCEAVPAEDFERLIGTGRTLPAHLLRMHRRPLTLLLVDDEPNILSALRRLLRGSGYQIVTAGSGPEGLEVLARQPVDVIVSDQRMPNMTGVDFLRTVKRRYPETVRIVLSGFTELQAVTSAVNEGAIYKFLTKPWDDGQLREHIAEAFAHKQMTDENRRLSQEVRAANQRLAAANRRLEDVLRQQEQQIQNDGIMLDIVREVLQHVPVPVVGLADDQIVAFANTAAHRLLSGARLALGGSAQALMPQVVAALDGLEEGRTAIAELSEGRYEIAYRCMGNGTRSRGIVVTLVPLAVAALLNPQEDVTSLN